ncbi:hypothetical protein BB559_005607 [Furculomyces boomerangus]|uniref:methionine--tRNA ligase n=2 Tax=Harpellales TaxID=61421 RepID=A0A2T9Y7P2_9FUNG|nr:hypothetical protein BB559_005607 [Furculomyces boomerangus]PVZ96789.1 hypothetical protein BB558_007273 [Smittium angustum]
MDTTKNSTDFTFFLNGAPPATGSLSAIGLLKIALAISINNLSIQTKSNKEIKSKLPFWMVFNDTNRKLIDANSIIRYIYGIRKLDPSNMLQQELVLEWEEKILSCMIENKDISAHVSLNIIENRIKDGKISSENNGANIVVFANIYDCFQRLDGKGKAKYPGISNWFSAMLSNEKVASAIRIYESQTKEILTRPEPAETNRKVNSNVAFNFDPKKIVEVKEGERNTLITSALPYVNNIPHLGNIIGSVLSADVYARYSRARGVNTLYICGTDEYGTATETKALEENISCQELCDKYHKIHSDVYKWFNISFDWFGRTTTPLQTEITQEMFMKVHGNDYTKTESMHQLYCEKHKRFLADRFVEGTCPKCGYTDARGDQCDKCGTLINAVELIDPRCKLDGSAPIVRESTHLFLDLEKLQVKCEMFVSNSYAKGRWSSNGLTITKSWLNEGLKPRCITRDLKWGVPVPLEGFEDKVFYVWFDACIGYISLTANYTKNWETWWKNPKNVNLYQFMGKDNVPFHTVVFPSTQIATGDDYTMLHHISTTEYLNYESGKFSKSRGIGVFGNSAKDTGVDVDVWRYFLLSNRPESSDTMFTWSEFIARNNNELLANLGNFCSRILKFTDSTSKYAGILPQPSAEILGYGDSTSDSAQVTKSFISDINSLLSRYNSSLEAVSLRAGLKLAMEISARGNQYLQDSKFDNSLFTNSREACDTVVYVCVNLVYLLSAVFSPYLPTVSENICKMLNAPARLIPDEFTFDLLPGHVIGTPMHLFSQIDDKMADVWRGKYGGSQE